MTTLLSLLESLGAASVPLLWLPLLAWTLVWAATEGGLRLACTLHPALRYRVAQAALLSLPFGLVLAACVDVPALPWAAPAVVYVADSGVAAVYAGASAVPGEGAGPLTPLSVAAVLGAAVCLWALAAAVRLLRLAIQAHALRRLRQTLPVVAADGFDDAAHDAARRVGLRRPVAVVATDADVVPMTFGLWRPLVVVPASLAGPELRLALAHEFVHVRAWDALAQWVEALAAAVFPFHPAVGHLCRRLDLLREMTCDAAVLADPAVGRHAYASLVSSFVSPPAPAVRATLGMADTFPHVHQRLSAMTSLPSSASPTCAPLLVAAAVLVVGALTVIASGAIAQPAPTLVMRSAGTDSAPPLLVVDGGTAEGALDDLGLAPADFHSVTVLKGEAAVERFGEAAANGAVVVTTQAAADAQGLPPFEPGPGHLRVVRSPSDSASAVILSGRRTEDGARIRIGTTESVTAGDVDEIDGATSIRVVGAGSSADPSLPLYVIDGEVASELPADLDAGKIRSVEVLKGESARARYGENGANGVVLVTTHSASTSRPAVTPASPSQLVGGETREFEVHSAYPNPTTGAVSIVFSLPREADVQLDVFDATGRRVQTGRPVRTTAGPRQSLEVDASDLAMGTYTYRLRAYTADQTYTGSGTFSVVR